MSKMQKRARDKFMEAREEVLGFVSHMRKTRFLIGLITFSFVLVGMFGRVFAATDVNIVSPVAGSADPVDVNIKAADYTINANINGWTPINGVMPVAAVGTFFQDEITRISSSTIFIFNGTYYFTQNYFDLFDETGAFLAQINSVEPSGSYTATLNLSSYPTARMVISDSQNLCYGNTFSDCLYYQLPSGNVTYAFIPREEIASLTDIYFEVSIFLVFVFLAFLGLMWRALFMRKRKWQ